VPKTGPSRGSSNLWNACRSRRSPEGDVWTYELKLDGYRVIAVKGSGKLTLYSRRGTPRLSSILPPSLLRIRLRFTCITSSNLQMRLPLPPRKLPISRNDSDM
jgi:hypothetical protein